MTIERTLTGAFHARPLGAGAWRLANEDSVEVYLSGVASAAGAPLAEGSLAEAPVTAIALAWPGADDYAPQAGCAVRLISAGGTERRLIARTAIVHEPRPRLFDGLPLVVLDDAARRFWSRVFFVVRMPGGRRLLRWIAQRSGGA